MTTAIALRKVPGDSQHASPTGRPSIPGVPPTAYDAVPYRSYPYAQAHPDRLATVATLLGLSSAGVARCRVLELGCCSGGNLIPMAEQLPGAAFVGIDASGRQVAHGQRAVERLGLANIRLVHGDILSIDASWGEFDYILCHGVYSWVPPAVQAKILAVCAQHLSPRGVAYVSYNTYPGWRLRGVIRDMMRYRARGLARPEDQLKAARALAEMLVGAVAVETNPYGLLLKQELDLLRDKDESYLLHEHLEEVNEPLYFSQFIERARASGLDYLGEADFGSMSPRNLPGAGPGPGALEGPLRSLSNDVIELEQYMDFVRNRMFRQTLLVRAAAAGEIQREVAPERLVAMHIASPARPVEAAVDLSPGVKAEFRGPQAVTTSSDPLVKAAWLTLAQRWPQPVAFAELLALAWAKLNQRQAIVDPAVLGRQSRRLAEPLLEAYTARQVELSLRAPGFSINPWVRPVAPAYARLQAESAALVTNLRHESVTLGDLHRHVLQLLDGTRDRAALLEALVQRVESGQMLLHQDGRALRDSGEVRRLLPEPLDVALADLGRQALLRGDREPEA